MLYASIEATRGNHSFHTIQEASIKQFGEDLTIVTGSGALSRAENIRKNLRKDIDMKKVLESFLSKLKPSYGNIHKVIKSGARGLAVRFSNSQVINRSLFSRENLGVCVGAALLNSMR